MVPASKAAGEVRSRSIQKRVPAEGNMQNSRVGVEREKYLVGWLKINEHILVVGCPCMKCLLVQSLHEISSGSVLL